MNRPRHLVDTLGIRNRLEKLAEELGARFVRRSGVYGYPTIGVPFEDSVVLIEVRNTEQGMWTRAALPFHDPDRIVLAVTPEGIVTRVLKSLGMMQDIELGEARFDARFRVKGQPEEDALRVLGDPVPELLLRQPHSARLRITPRWSESFGIPDDVAMIELLRTGAVTSIDEVRGMIELVTTVGQRLDPVAEHPDGDEVTRSIRTIQRLSGGLMDRLTGSTVWDFDPERARAAERLGRLGDPRAVPALVGALSDEDDRVVVAAIGSLGELGSQAGVPEFARLLGRRKPRESGRPIADLAAEALREAGRGELVTAFDRAMKHEPHALVRTAGDLRDEVVEALIEILESFDLDARIAAAEALGHLGAREALPILRDNSYQAGMRTKFMEACRDAVRRIESRASLPRAAGATPSDDTTTLPRPAGPGDGASPDTLPRPASED